MVGIVAYGAYVPWLRLQRAAVYQANAWFAPGLKSLAKGERALANWDEDTITMAVEAARDCLGSRDRNSVAALALASTSAPYADRQNAGIVKEALNLSDCVGSVDYGGSQKAGTGALLQTLLTVAGGAGQSLCVAAEKHRAAPASDAELNDGHGAAAFLIGTERPIARFIGAHTMSVDFVDHFREVQSSFDYRWESRWIREEGYMKIAGMAIRDGLTKFGLRGADITHLVVPIAERGVAEGLAKQAGIGVSAIRDGMHATVGYTGAAHALLMLADLLRIAKPNEKILVLGFGQGADVLLFETTEALANYDHPQGVASWVARRKPESNYIKYLSFAGNLELDRGMRAEFDQKQPMTTLYRNRKTVLGLVGSRCTRTGEIQYPRSEISVGASLPETGTQEDYPLAERRARVLTYTADSLGYTPDPPGYYGMIEFEGGGRMVCEFTDVDPDAVEVGASLRMVFRIKAVDERRGFTKYFWKATPLAQPATSGQTDIKGA